MSKEQMIEAIRTTNRGAQFDYLMRFDEQALQTYLNRLRHLHGHRGRESRWVRATTDRAVVMRTVAA